MVLTRAQANKHQKHDIDYELEACRALKKQQEEEFQAALAEDQRKEKEKERIKKMDKEMEMKLQQEMDEARKTLGKEARENEGECVLVRMKTPDGGHVERRFLRKDPLNKLVDWAVCQGVPRSQVRLFHWEQEITKMDLGRPMESLEPCRRLAIILEKENDGMIK